MNKHILIISLYSHNLGNPQPIYLAKQLSLNGNQVTFVAPFSEQMSTSLRASNINAITSPEWTFPIRKSWLPLLISRIILKRINKIDLAIGIDQVASQASWILYKSGCIPRYGCYLLELWSRTILYKKNSFQSNLNAKVWREASFFVHANDLRKEYFMKQTGLVSLKHFVIQNAPLLDWPTRYTDPVLQETLRLSYIGTVNRPNGLHYIIPAIADCNEPVHLDITGSLVEPYTSELRDEIYRMNLNQNIRISEAIPREMLQVNIGNADVSIAFYPWKSINPDINFALCAPNKVFESLAVGRPVLASDNPSMMFLSNERCGWNVDVENQNSLLGCLKEICINREEVITRARNARRLFEENLNFESQSKDFIDFINEFH